MGKRIVRKESILIIYHKRFLRIAMIWRNFRTFAADMEQFRAMRRKRQQLSKEESISILQKSTAGTLALLGDGGYPYAVPISYVYADGKLYFHSALSGHKVDAIRNCD